MNTFTRAILTIILPLSAQANCWNQCQDGYDGSAMNLQFALDVGAISYSDVKVLRIQSFLIYSECTDQCTKARDEFLRQDAEVQQMFQDTYKAIEDFKNGGKQP